MAEGGQFPWKRQTIDSSRGPAADYSSLNEPLPSPPKGVEWKLDEPTKEWRLVRVDAEDDKRRYDLEVAETWNPHTGRVQPSIYPVVRKDKKELSDEDYLVKEDTPEEAQSNTNKNAVENIDYVVHTVLPTDTLPGLCLRYKTKPTLLRQVNKFSGSNLLLAPSKLIIPLQENNVNSIKIQDKTTPHYKLHAILAEYPHLRQTECTAYLEMNDWDLPAAMQSIKEDEAWEQEEEKKQEMERRKPKAVLNVHVAVPAAEPVNKTVDSNKEKEKDSLMEPLLRELELSPSGHLV